MKTILASFLAAAFTLVLFSGCGDSGSGAVDARPLQQAFAQPTDAQQAHLDQAVQALRAGNYQDAAAALQRLAAANPTEDQRRAIESTLERIRARTADAAERQGIIMP
ncbi:MAG: hypothetical protein EA425_11110 [Puniceicoccaceae bacterium]|nr:MAG: hypothetical protein EA425_11110 [Puniceicoccaceae bacterium]